MTKIGGYNEADEIVLVCKVTEYKRREDDVNPEKFIFKPTEYHDRNYGRQESYQGQNLADECHSIFKIR